MALNEAMFREGNERMNAWPERQEAPQTEEQPFLCECADPDCRKHLSITSAEYEAVRKDAMHFVIVPAHQRPDAESVVEQTDRYMVVEKHEDVRALAERTDPRNA